MANTQAIANSFKVEMMNGVHAFGTTVTRGTTAADTFKAALYLASATVNASTTVYTTSGELAATGNYTAGGVAFSWLAPANTGATAFSTPSASFSWSNLTSSGPFDCVLLYNSAQGNRAVAAYTFGVQSISAGNFSLTMQSNDASNALLRIA